MAEADFTLPPYIEERNAKALRAGLRIEKQEIEGGRLVTWYRGEDAQALASGMTGCDSPPKRVGGRKAMWYWSSDHLRSGPLMGAMREQWFKRVSPTECRLVFVEEFPDWERRDDGIEVYRLKWKTVYVGDLDRLIEAGIAPERARSEYLCRVLGWNVLWEREEYHGRSIFTVYHEAREKLEEERAIALRLATFAMMMRERAIKTVLWFAERGATDPAAYIKQIDAAATASKLLDEANRMIERLEPRSSRAFPWRNL